MGWRVVIDTTASELQPFDRARPLCLRCDSILGDQAQSRHCVCVHCDSICFGPRTLVRLVLVWCGALVSLAATAQRPASPASLKIDVLEGEGAINNIRLHRAKEPVVRVVDEKNQPVRGASVTFLLPDMGPGAEFPGDVRALALLTDERGQAVARGLASNGIVGKFQIHVAASYQSQRATAVINQVNAEPGGAASGGPSKKILLLALIGGAAAGGVAFAVSHGGGGGGTGPVSTQPAGSSTPVGIVIAPGTPVFQPPH